MVAAYYILHYGKEYLHESMKSVYPFVDKIFILYTDLPSHGTISNLQNPDSREELKAQVFDPKHKVTWIDGRWPNETKHRNAAMDLCKQHGAEIVLVCDYDEVWVGDVSEMIHQARLQGKFEYRIRMRHIWQKEWVCDDVHRQGRIYNLNGEGIEYMQDEVSILHYGYSISDELMKYKLSIHGHKSELREGWFEDTWMARKTKDCHPVCIDFWNPVEWQS